MSKKWFKRLILGLLLLYCLGLVVRISTRHKKFQWDFRLQYHAAKVFAEGLNPYDKDVLSQATRTKMMWYAYPPATLWFYRMFTMVDYHAAFYLFLYLKCAVLIWLIYLWREKFLNGAKDAFFYVFCLLAFNGAIYLDIAAGNINMLEQLMIWLAFYFYLKRRLFPFCVFILMAASFKLIPLAFLCLLLGSDNKKKYLYLYNSVGVFLVYLIVQYIITPQMFSNFLGGAIGTLPERRITNPATLPLIKDIFQLLENFTGATLPQNAELIPFFGIVAIVVSITWWAYIRLNSVEVENKERIGIFLFCATYALIVPRFKDYSYILLIVPTYFIIKRVTYLKAYPLLFILIILSSRNVTLPGFNFLFPILWEYYPLMLAYFVWSLYLYEIFVSMKKPITATSLNSE